MDMQQIISACFMKTCCENDGTILQSTRAAIFLGAPNDTQREPAPQ